MKRLICILAALLTLMLSAAYAAEPLSVDIAALDYQTGRAVSKTYVENELFRLRVDIGIPRFASTADMELIVELDGVMLNENDLRLADGSYYLTGTVTAQPAALRVVIKDTAFENAETAAELYDAMQHDRTVSKTYYFNTEARTEAAATAGTTVIIPKTGDRAIGTVSAIALLGLAAAAAMLPKHRI